MMKRSLEDILLEARRITIKERREIMSAINRLADRNLADLLENVKEEVMPWEGFGGSLTNSVLACYDELADLTYEERLYALNHINFKEYICLMEHVDEEEEVGISNKTWISGVRNDMVNMLDYIFILLRIRGDKDVCDFMRIDFDVLVEMFKDLELEPPVYLMSKRRKTMLLDYVDKERTIWKSHFFRICGDYDIDEVKRKFIELARDSHKK